MVSELILWFISAVLAPSVCSLTTNKLLNSKVTTLVEEWCLLTTLSKRWLGAGMVGRLVARAAAEQVALDSVPGSPGPRTISTHRATAGHDGTRQHLAAAAWP